MESTKEPLTCTGLYHEKYSSCHPRISNTAFLRVAAALKKSDDDQLQQINPVPVRTLRHRRCCRLNGRLNFTIHTAVKYDANRVRRCPVEQDALLPPLLP